MSFGELRKQGLIHNRGTLSRHLKNLEKEGLVKHRKVESNLTILPHAYDLTRRARLNLSRLIMLEESPPGNFAHEPTKKDLKNEMSEWRKEANDENERRSMLQAMLAALSEPFGTEQTLRDRASQIRGLWMDTRLPNPPGIVEIESIYKYWREHGMVKKTDNGVSVRFNRKQIVRGGRILTHLAYGLITGKLPESS